jgi:hypothetical protein
LLGRGHGLDFEATSFDGIRQEITQRLCALYHLDGTGVPVDWDGGDPEFDDELNTAEGLFVRGEHFVAGAASHYLYFLESNLDSNLQILQEGGQLDVALESIVKEQAEADRFCWFLQGLIESAVKDFAVRHHDGVLVARHGLCLLEIVDLLRQAAVETTESARTTCLETLSYQPEETNGPEEHQRDAPEQEDRSKEDETRNQDRVHPSNSDTGTQGIEDSLVKERSA